MEFTASQIAGFINGKIIGDQNAVISGVSPIEQGEEGHLSFVAQDRFSHFMDKSKCSVLIVSENLIQDKIYPSTLIVVENAYLSFQVLMNLYQQMQSRKTGIESGSFFHPSSELGENVYVGAFSFFS
jgi:UDP-3-O-[3-hydroxymyristoyl] glucosamine N-acyltransferase